MPLIHETIPYLAFDKIHKDQRFIEKGLGKEGPPAGIADTGISMSTGEKWSWLYEKPEGPDRGKYRVIEAKDFSGSYAIYCKTECFPLSFRDSNRYYSNT